MDVIYIATLYLKYAVRTNLTFINDSYYDYADKICNDLKEYFYINNFKDCLVKVNPISTQINNNSLILWLDFRIYGIDSTELHELELKFRNILNDVMRTLNYAKVSSRNMNINVVFENDMLNFNVVKNLENPVKYLTSMQLGEPIHKGFI